VPALQKAIAQLMESRQERPEERSDPPALAELLAQLRERTLAEERAHAEAFARELFGKAPALLAAHDIVPLAAMAASAYGFLRSRGRSPLALRVFTPQAERDGWSSPLTVVESVLDDRPFIVDTLCHAIEARGGEIRLLLHPVLGVERGTDGSLLRVAGPDATPAHESFFHAEVANLPADETLQQELADRLRQLLRVTSDYPAMRERVATCAARLRAHPMPPPWDDDRNEVAAFYDWLANKSFVYLGYREYDIGGSAPNREARVRPGTGLGILRDESRTRFRSARPLPPDLAVRLERQPLLLVSKTHSLSPIHRAAPMDDIILKEIDASGAVTGVRRLVGLFTAKAYGDAPSEVPLLRRCLAAILAREGVVADSYDERDLVALFNSFPREQLLASELTDIRRVMEAIRAADAHAGVEVVCRPDALRRGLFAVILVPRARFSTELHARITAVLRERLDDAVLYEHLALDERPVARLHYYCSVPPDVLAQPPVEALQADLNALLRTWDDELRETLATSGARLDAERLATRYARALPVGYKTRTPISDAARDVRCLEALSTTGQTQIEVVGPRQPMAPHALKLYLANETVVLSDFVPVLENLGLRVLGQDVVALELPELESACIHTFAVTSSRPTADLLRAAPALVAALHALRAKHVENDRLNALVLYARLDWRAVDLLRAFVEHGHQIGFASRQMLIESLTANPDTAARLFAWFAVKFDPAASPLPAADRATGPVAAARTQFLTSLDAVPSLTHDRALRALGELLDASVRTNFFSAPVGAAVAIKFDGTQLAALPPPRPAIETWVHGTTLSGVHLRAGRIARGGIRASDRPDDFRTEILGLMRTQVVKNAVIVPVGAKGGFVIKDRQRGVLPDPARVEAAYRAFIAALLSITDNHEQDQIVAPPGQVVYDAADPYLVVAADKGTATFSDLANELSAARHFWLGDAFASGGQHGYDHKRLGITARGAWESARQHFRELGRDLDRETVTIAGIGDMSGDVFGNGMLRSRHLRLRAAFNHRDIFLDPDPDPELSYRERERLFHLPHSGWTDYASTTLSRGGGIYARAAKTIPLSPEARALLEIDAATPSGEEVVRAILRLPVDLLWNGGIGTYVKAGDERHAEVADPANDPVRIDARELRAAVVVEGGNLGLTQRARVEYALGGGRVNTDAIDNSAGVDLSDHEVNLKIALQPLLVSGTLTAEARNAQLAEAADAVCAAVLAHTRSQTFVLGLDQRRSRTRIAAFRDLVSILEAEAGLDRQLAQLPSREALRARRGVFLGLTRPELAVLMAYTKLDLQHRVAHAPLCDEPELEAYLRGYFPAALFDRHPAAVLRHPLRREIIAVGLANQLIDTMGITFLVEVVRDTGRDVLEVVRAWTAAGEIADATALRGQLAAVRERLSAEAERAALALAAALDAAARWLVQTQPNGVPLAQLIARFREPVSTLLATWPELMAPERRAAHAAAVNELAGAGLEPALAEHLACLRHIDEALEVAQIGHAANVPLTTAAQGYFATADLIDLDWLREALPTTLTGEDRWDPRAAASLLETVRDLRRQLTLHVLGYHRDGTPIDECLRAYVGSCREQLDVVSGLIVDLKAAAPPTLPALLVVMREIARLARPGERGRPW